MFSKILLLALTLLPAFALATPLPRQQDEPSWCKNFGSTAFDTLSNFTLAAYNSTGSNANDTGVPLVLGEGGSFQHVTIRPLTTLASWGKDDYPNLSMNDGAMWANKPGAPNNTVSTSIQSGYKVQFVTNDEGLAQAAQQYCGLVSTSAAHGSLPALALDTHTDLFSLCTSKTIPALVNVIYNATEDNGNMYDYNTCYPVTIHIVENN